MPKSVSSALRQIMQKMGDSLTSRSFDRDSLAKDGRALAEQSRDSVNRNWGDQDQTVEAAPGATKKPKDNGPLKG